ncbi:MAG: SMC family ATPase [Thermoplasmata archaeon]
MRIGYLELHNYRKFRELKLQFPDGLIGILGNNGAGKTTIIESIAWALFGNVEEVVRTSREGVRRVGAAPGEHCSAVLEFEMGGTEYRIVREMSGKTLAMRAELRTGNTIIADGDREVRRAVEKLLGMDHKSFFTSIFARQKELNALQNVAPGERKKVVLRMLRIDGLDTILARIRADRRDVTARIQGAERTLLTEDGREREKVLRERLPDLKAALDDAQKAMDEAESKERVAVAELQDAKERRDGLKKDLDAYNQASSELMTKLEAIKHRRDREKSLEGRIAEITASLRKLPELEEAELRYKVAKQRRDVLESERAKYERARQIEEQIAAEEKELRALEGELVSAQAKLTAVKDFESQLQEVERTKLECESQRSEIAQLIGKLKAQVDERRSSAERDRRKLDDIRRAGRDGICPTCERRLDEAYDLLVSKLSKDVSEYETQISAHTEELRRLEVALEELVKREDALRRKRSRLEQDLTKFRRLEASLTEKEAEVRRMKERLDARRRTMAELGPVRFDEAEYSSIKEQYEFLERSHEELLRLRNLKEQAENLSRELADIREAISRSEMEASSLKSVVEALAPKKDLYDRAIRELDEKTVALNSAKDALRKASAARDKASAELERVEREIDEIGRVKKAIEQDRTRADDLALVEEVVSNFKDHLIGKIAPALSELSSKELEAMTDGRYSRVELDEDYEMQIEDQGQEYPVSRFSGGEADLANLSLRLAISNIIADRTGASPVNIMILDEIFGSQDANRKRSVMTALSRLSNRFRQIFIITHIEDVKDATNYIIRVTERDDGTSTAELVT